jgi:hypothetical protein
MHRAAAIFGSIALVAVAVAVAACGGSMPSVPGGPSRASGQSSLMDKTVAGQNKCSPKSHDRPFIIEWDATDLSQFEGITTNDIVFVRYEGCELRVIDSCRNDSVKGSLGAYKPVDWTSGSLEKISISNEGDLYAKLPLGAATLGGRVAAGETFRMEYFVSGVRTATRPVVYRGDVDPMAGCKGATHFVYAYNLGAFALGSTKNLRVEADATLWGVGAGGTSKQSNSADKRAGLLESCRGESAKEVQTCKAPIRLTLREIDPGSNPDGKAAVAPEGAPALNLAGQVDAKMKRNEKAQAHADAARTKHVARDGKGCISELDQADKLDPRPFVVSTNSSSYWSALRAQCLMLSGQCPAGRQLMRKYMEANLGGQMGPEQIDTSLDVTAGQFCQGGNLSPRDQLLQSNEALRVGSQTKKDTAYCNQSYDRVKKAAAAATPNGPDDMVLTAAKDGDHELTASQCLARAGDCPNAWVMFTKSKMGAFGAASFKNIVAHCKDFTPPTSGPAADPKAVTAQNQAAMSAAMTSASQKMYKKDGTCLADLDAYDRHLTEATQRSTSATSALAQMRAICLMLSSRCDEGEKLQRAALTHQKVSTEIIGMNIKSLRHDWCK